MPGLRSYSLGWIAAYAALVAAGCEGPEQLAAGEQPTASPQPDAGEKPVDDDALGPSCAQRWAEERSSGPRWIAFEALGRLRMIDVADPGADPVTVTTSAGEGASGPVLEPAWSADGRWFAFTTYTGDGWTLLALEVVGDWLGPARTILTAERGKARYDDFRWAPRGKWLAYVEHGSDTAAPRSKLMLRDLDADQPVVAAEGAQLSQLRWSPDGTGLSAIDEESGVRLLVRVGEDGRVSAHELEVDPAAWPIWSPDGRFLATFDDALRLYDAHGDPPRAIKLAALEPRMTAGLRWSNDGRFLITERYVEAEASTQIVLEAFDTRDLGAEPRAWIVRDRSHEVPPGLGDNGETLQPPHFAFVPNAHAFVAALEDGWTYVPLRAELGEPRVLAPLEAGVVGLTGARELLWIDSAGIYATHVDGAPTHVLFRLGDPVVRDEHSWNLGQNVAVAPAHDRLAIARPGASSTIDLVLTTSCEPERVAFGLPYRWSGTFTPNGYAWQWLSDGRSLMQQTQSTDHPGLNDDISEQRVRLELVRIIEGRVELRTLIEVPRGAVYLPLVWREQP